MGVWINLGKGNIEQTCQLGKSNAFYHQFFQTKTYTGTYYYGEFERHNAFEAYITQEEFDQVQRPKKSERPSRQSYLLSGLVSCGKCGEPMHCERATKKGRADLHYCICASRAKHGKACGLPKIRAERLERIAVETLLETLDPDYIKSLAQRLTEESQLQASRDAGTATALEQRINEESEKIKKLSLKFIELDALGAGNEAKALIDQAVASRNEAQQKLARLRAGVSNYEGFQINLKLLEKCKLFLEAWLSENKISVDLDKERVALAKEMLRSFGVELSVYPAEKEKGPVQLYLTLNLSGVNSDSPGGKCQTPLTISLQKTL